MRKLIVGLTLLSSTLAPAGAAMPTDTGFMSSNVTYMSTVPYEVGGTPSGARLLGKYLYVAGARTLSIYDVSDPLAPELESITPIGPVFPNEDVDTNGKILLVTSETIGKKLFIYDVENKSAPVKLAELSEVRDHTFTCVLKCRYGWGSRGTIVDLKDPSNPEIAGYWGGSPPNDGFDVTEVAPGLVLTATRTIKLLDARKDPLHPETLAMGGTVDNRLIHSNRWPRKGRDDFFLVQGETPFSQTCDEASGAFMTWDATKWKKTHSFTLDRRVQGGERDLRRRGSPRRCVRLHEHVVPGAPSFPRRGTGGGRVLRARHPIPGGGRPRPDRPGRLFHARRRCHDRVLLDHTRDRLCDRRDSAGSTSFASKGDRFAQRAAQETAAPPRKEVRPLRSPSLPASRRACR